MQEDAPWRASSSDAAPTPLVRAWKGKPPPPADELPEAEDAEAEGLRRVGRIPHGMLIKKFLVKKPEDVDVKDKQKVVNKFKQLKIDAQRQEHKDKMIKAIKKDMMNKHSKKDSVKKDMAILKDNEGEITYSSRSLWKPPLPKTCCTHLCARPIHEKYAPYCCKACAMFDCGLYNEAHARHGGKCRGGPMSKQQFKSWLTSKNLWLSDIELRCCCRDALDACKRPQLLQWAFDCWVLRSASSR